MICPKCNTQIPDSAIVCRSCGNFFSRTDDATQSEDYGTQKVQANYHQPPPQPPPPPQPEHHHYNQPYHYPPPPHYPPNYHHQPPHPNYQPSNVNVVVPKNESVAFAVITLILFLFSPLGFVSYPFALILTIIGLFTGPKRGCFTSMFIMFFVIPVIIILVLLSTAEYILEDIFDSVFSFF